MPFCTETMEVKMADLLHHHRLHHASEVDVPTRVYWGAAIGLTLLAVGLIYAMLTGSAAFDTGVPLPMTTP
jgi:hypothetical protein